MTRALPDSLRGIAVTPGDNDYTRVRSTYMRAGAPTRGRSG